MKQTYISFVGLFEGEKIAFTYNQMWDRIESSDLLRWHGEDDPHYAELLAYQELLSDLTAELPVLETQVKDSLTVTIYDAGERKIIVAECMAGGWIDAAYVIRQTDGTFNPPGVDVKVHL